MKILILCTGNSCRSQMAHGFLQAKDSRLNVFSAGTEPVSQVNPTAIKVMQEAGVDISTHTPKHVDKYSKVSWDYVITVCGGAKEHCPSFLGKVAHRLHIGFDDPSYAEGNKGFVLSEFYRVRDEIREAFNDFFEKTLQAKL